LVSFDDLVAEFVRRPKKALRRPRWRVQQHSDYAALSILVRVEGEAHLRGRVIVAAHRLVTPPKYCFSLLFRRERVLALDVNPARWHRNLLAGGSVSVTHWQRWPAMEAEPDGRDQSFSIWLSEFLRTANITCDFRVTSPPRGKQLDLVYGK
jgi:hypothetical protein